MVAPAGVPADYQEHARLMMDLLALSYQTDMTRISTFMLAREVSAHSYPEIGVSDPHHPLSHHQDEAAKLERGQSKVAKAEAKAGSDGHVGANEQARVQRAENHQSKHIYHQKHDAQQKN